jgi:opacity protein-like surface antigen
MKFRTLLAASALAVAASGAFAEDFNQNVAFVPDAGIPGAGSAGWGVTHVQAGAFTDTFTFTGLSEGFFSGSLVTIGFQDSQNIDFTSVNINGQSYTLAGQGTPLEVAAFNMTSLQGPLVLTVQGVAGPNAAVGDSISASYAGTANISPVPEAQTAAMLLAGLGVIGMLGRRRFTN